MRCLPKWGLSFQSCWMFKAIPALRWMGQSNQLNRTQIIRSNILPPQMDALTIADAGDSNHFGNDNTAAAWALPEWDSGFNVYCKTCSVKIFLIFHERLKKAENTNTLVHLRAQKRTLQPIIINNITSATSDKSYLILRGVIRSLPNFTSLAWALGLSALCLKLMFSF